MRNHFIRVVGDEKFDPVRAERAIARGMMRAPMSNIEETLKAYRQKLDEVAVATGVSRKDDGFHMARELESIKAELLEEKFPAFNALNIFPVGPSLPVGARTVTQRRISKQGAAAIYRAGHNIPRVNVSKVEESIKVVHVASSFGMDLFERQSAGFASSSLDAELRKAARFAIEQKINELLWYGDDDAMLYGILNNPYLQKVALPSTISFDGNTAADTVIAAFTSYWGYARRNSKQVFGPDSCAISEQAFQYLQRTPRSTTTDTSILKWLLENTPGLKKIIPVWELQSVGPSIGGAASDGILFFRDDPMAIEVQMVNGMQMLPEQQDGFQFSTACWESTAGVWMKDAGNNLLLWVDATA